MIRLRSGLVSSLPADAAVIVFVFAKEKRPSGAFLFGSRVDKALASARDDGFTAKSGQVCVVKTVAEVIGDRRARRFIFVGLGSESDATTDSLRKGASLAARRAIALGVSSLAIRPAILGSISSAAQAVVEGAILGTYRFTAFQSQPEPRTELKNIFLIAKDAADVKQLADGARRGEIFGTAVTFARDLINTPPSSLTPADFVTKAKAAIPSSIKLKVLAKKDIERLGMGALLGVNRGSHQPPYFLHFVYKPKGKARRRIGICGKGITFDSGGLSLKPAANMETMKYDMAGAASVLSLFRALPLLKPSVEVHGFTPLTENMPGGNATKPGDVLRTMRGRTIEVLNTDAEGRLVLADALSYACRQNLDEVFDIATLTGACVVALGTGIAGLLGTSPVLNARVKDAAMTAGEKVWELPLEKDYEPLLKSHVADIKNIGPVGQAGTILAALFMKTFVDAGLPWAHLDIASTGWTSSQTALSEVGATGVMIRTLLTYLTSYN